MPTVTKHKGIKMILPPGFEENLKESIEEAVDFFFALDSIAMNTAFAIKEEINEDKKTFILKRILHYKEDSKSRKFHDEVFEYTTFSKMIGAVAKKCATEVAYFGKERDVTLKFVDQDSKVHTIRHFNKKEYDLLFNVDDDISALAPPQKDNVAHEIREQLKQTMKKKLPKLTTYVNENDIEEVLEEFF